MPISNGIDNVHEFGLLGMSLNDKVAHLCRHATTSCVLIGDVSSKMRTSDVVGGKMENSSRNMVTEIQ